MKMKYAAFASHDCCANYRTLALTVKRQLCAKRTRSSPFILFANKIVLFLLIENFHCFLPTNGKQQGLAVRKNN